MKNNNLNNHKLLNTILNSVFLFILFAYISGAGITKDTNNIGLIFYISFFIYYFSSIYIFSIYYKKLFDNIPPSERKLNLKYPSFPRYTIITKNIMLASVNICIVFKMDIDIDSIRDFIYIIILIGIIGVTVTFLEKITLLIAAKGES